MIRIALKEWCPVAKWVTWRFNNHKRYIVVYKARLDHLCAAACTDAAILMFDAV